MRIVNRCLTTALAGLVAITGAAHTAAADLVTYTSQSRTISAFAIDFLSGRSDSSSASASDFGPFNRSVSAVAGIGRGNASQQSVLDTMTGIDASISVTGVGSINQACEGGGSALFTINFTLNGPVVAILSYSVFDGSFSFSGPGVSIGLSGFGDAAPAPVVLQPGSYTFVGSCSLATRSPGTGVSVQGRLLIPSPATPTVGLLLLGMVAGRRRRAGILRSSTFAGWAQGNRRGAGEP